MSTVNEESSGAHRSCAGPVLDVRELVVDYRGPFGTIRALDSATLRVNHGDIVAIVGESGSGKSTLGMATGRLLASNARYPDGEILVCGEPVLTCDMNELRRIRRDALGFVFQNPISALNPTARVGSQMRQAAGDGFGSDDLASSLLEVGLDDPHRVLRAFPHQLSGGMAQRVGIAMALRRDPRLLVADEPTASVDTTLRRQILELLVERSRARGCALVLLTHDLRAVAAFTSQIAVMYAGRVVEAGPTVDVLSSPRHPYTQALTSALPGEERPGERLRPIGGAAPVLTGRCGGCGFAARCPSAFDHCGSERPVRSVVREGAEPPHVAWCHLAGETELRDSLRVRDRGSQPRRATRTEADADTEPAAHGVDGVREVRG